MNTAGVLLEVEVDEEGQLRYFALLSILALVVRTVHKLFFQLNDWHRNSKSEASLSAYCSKLPKIQICALLNDTYLVNADRSGL